MSYLVIDDFKLGMDRRRSRVAGTLGALWLGINGHITRGGDFERRKKFVLKTMLPASTVGLAVVNNRLYTFGSGPEPVGMPANVKYQRLEHPGTAQLTEVLDTTTFDGQLYAVALFSNGSIYHYYGGTRVEDWDTIAAAVADTLAAPARRLAELIDRNPYMEATAAGAVITITASRPGVPFTITKDTTNESGGTGDQDITLAEVQPNIVEGSEIRSSTVVTITGGSSNPGTNQITSLTINGVYVLGFPGTPVNWDSSNAATAAALADAINAAATTPEYTAEASGPAVTVYAVDGTGSTPNGYSVIVGTSGDVTTSVSGNMAGGTDSAMAQAQIWTATLSGTVDQDDEWEIEIATAIDVDTPELLTSYQFVTTTQAAGMGTTCLTFQQKIYSVTASLLYYSAVQDPTDWEGTGSGFNNMADQNEGSEPLTAVQEYQGKLAVFSQNHIRVWTIDVDPDNNKLDQTVPNSGTPAPQSVVPYGNIDVFYLSRSGVRSLRARDSSNAPAVNDIGVAIDEFVQEYLDDLNEERSHNSCAIIEPRDGRYWLAMGQRILVLSYFQGTKINAWTYYDLADELGIANLTIEQMVVLGRKVYMRSNDFLFLYGDDNGVTYPGTDEAVAELHTQFLSAKTPATIKSIKGFDIGCEGEWAVDLLPNPAREDVDMRVGVFNKPSFSAGNIAVQCPSAMFAVKAVCARAGYGRIANMAIHYKPAEAG